MLTGMFVMCEEREVGCLLHARQHLSTEMPANAPSACSSLSSRARWPPWALMLRGRAHQSSRPPHQHWRAAQTLRQVQRLEEATSALRLGGGVLARAAACLLCLWHTQKHGVEDPDETGTLTRHVSLLVFADSMVPHQTGPLLAATGRDELHTMQLLTPIILKLKPACLAGHVERG